MTKLLKISGILIIFLVSFITHSTHAQITQRDQSSDSQPAGEWRVEAGEVDQKSFFAEHRFIYNRSVFEIDKKYLGGQFTEYDFKLRDLRGYNRFRVAFQWVRDDGTNYEGIMFEMHIPRAERTMENALIDVRKAESWLFNSYQNNIDDYVRDFVAGEYYGMHDPKVKVLIQKTSKIGWNDFDGTENFIHLRFRVDGHEPVGDNKLWYVYTWYNDDTICTPGVDCLDRNRVEGQKGPFDYFTTNQFGDYVDRNLIIYAYWFLFAQSIFFVVGLPFAIVIVLALNFYMDYQLIYHFAIAMFAIAGWYDPEQNEQYNLFNYFIESILWWSTGTRMISYLMIANSLIPVAGPLLNGGVLALMYFIIFQ